MTGMGEKNENAVFCRGESMTPLFRPGDRILFDPCRIEDLRRGDVIIFNAPGQEERVVHRVVSTGTAGIRTKGDANLSRDSWEIRQKDIIGRAVSVERGGRVITVAGGLKGCLAAGFLGLVRKLDHRSSWVLHPVYHFFSRSGIARRLVPESVAPRIITLTRKNGEERQLLMGNKVIGRRLPGETAWRIRRPFRLFVDERTLP
ncbi:MAG TPA: signal peptidase I [Syntrophales bacterium]|nr:signal peptidase I [Syntrophales bacterium]HOX93345.1 signal peptidase I [Syntrophales bacterium]HPI56546.1 signal peptidase I [Syntrophales bacterium]HPN25033.1 signal peptidase I [Syntrophales bacterium]HQM29224.1 signal peptidase I [Syntrophales bacterium]